VQRLSPVASKEYFPPRGKKLWGGGGREQLVETRKKKKLIEGESGHVYKPGGKETWEGSC